MSKNKFVRSAEKFGRPLVLTGIASLAVACSSAKHHSPKLKPNIPAKIETLPGGKLTSVEKYVKAEEQHVNTPFQERVRAAARKILGDLAESGGTPYDGSYIGMFPGPLTRPEITAQYFPESTRDNLWIREISAPNGNANIFDDVELSFTLGHKAAGSLKNELKENGHLTIAAFDKALNSTTVAHALINPHKPVSGERLATLTQDGILDFYSPLVRNSGDLPPQVVTIANVGHTIMPFLAQLDSTQHELHSAI